MKYSGNMLETLESIVRRAEQNALTNQLLPYHGKGCACRNCETDRWATSPEAAEFVRRTR